MPEENFKTYCDEMRPHCGEPGIKSESKVCYWCYRGYHHATQHWKRRIREANEKLLEDNPDLAAW